MILKGEKGGVAVVSFKNFVVLRRLRAGRGGQDNEVSSLSSMEVAVPLDVVKSQIRSICASLY